jgi:LacI family transcriptional regulator
MARTRAGTHGATIVDIARKLRVSAMTVSRALTGSKEVSEKTRQRVLRCAGDLGYHPNRWARSLVTRRSSIMGVVIPDIAHSYYAEITRGVEEVADQAGYKLLLCHSSMDPRKERAEIDTLVGARVEGLIVASEQPETSPEIFLSLRKMGIPFVLVDRFFPGHDLPSVRVDDMAVGRLATGYLLGLGHRRIAHIRGPHLSPATLRYRGYLDALRKHGIRANKEWIVPGKFDIESGREAMNRLLDLKQRPTAVFAANDPMAIGAAYACRDLGLAVPGDISIVGAGNIEGAHHPNPFLTTVDWPRVELGRAAVGLLLAAIANPEHRQSRVEIFEPRLLSRQSTAPPADCEASAPAAN